MKYKKHIFVCVNERKDGLKSCGEAQGMDIVNAFKALILKDKLHVEVRAQRAGCLDVCNLGPALVVYPDAVFYGNVTLNDVEEIYQSHIKNNLPVERLKLKF